MKTVLDLKNTFQYAMHGAGAYKGLRQTNTKEAIEYWYSKGVKIMELDIAITSDKDYVAVAHSLSNKDLKRLEIFDRECKKTKEWFTNQKLFSISTKGLTPLCIKDIINLMKKYNDIIVMFDLYGFFTEPEAFNFTYKLSSLIGSSQLWDRCLLEAYNMNMVKGIYAGSSCVNIIYCARFEDNITDLSAVEPQELLHQNIFFVSYPWKYNKVHPGEIKKYVASGITVFSRTKDNSSHKILKAEGVNVNIVANVFNLKTLKIQKFLYYLTYIKRIFVKLYISIFLFKFKIE